MTKNKTYMKANIFIILIYQMGYSDLGYKGSGISTPNLENVAKNELLYTFFIMSSVATLHKVVLLFQPIDPKKEVF
jgi:arylsulfatase A-like enzyme